MTKQEQIDDPESVWNKTKDDEPVFCVVARDAVSVATIRQWARSAADAGAPLRKLAGAEGDVREFLAWQDEHGTKIPD